MKRCSAILFLTVLLFNLLGYQLVIRYMQHRNDHQLSALLNEEQYSNDELISIKTPLNLPYYTNSEQFERVDGTVEMEGIEYRYVKRRVFNDSLELLCLPNMEKKKLQSAGVDFFKLSNDWQSSQDGKKNAGTLKNVIPEFCEAIPDYTIRSLNAEPRQHHRLPEHMLPFHARLVQEQPPDAVPSFLIG